MGGRKTIRVFVSSCFRGRLIMSDMTRRDIVGMLALTPLSTVLKWPPARCAAPAKPWSKPAERRTHRPGLRANVLLAPRVRHREAAGRSHHPADERSGSATDAGAPEFMDFILTTYPDNQGRSGRLAWIDNECRDRYGQPFLTCSGTQRAALLDEIAWPAKAKPELSHGVAFFNRFRDMTASAFFSSKLGWRISSTKAIPSSGVEGCPPEA
jgi:hypothetical protein